MKIIFVADVHFGISGRTDDILNSLKSIREYAHKNEIQSWIILGDLFHDRRGVEWDVLGQVYDFFLETKEKYNQSVMAYPGNHDMFLKNSFEHHSMKALKNIITVIDDIALVKVENQRFRIIPFINYEDVFMNVVNAVMKDNDTSKDDIILTHVGVKNASLNECFLIKHWSFIDFTDVPHKVFTGHFHCQQQVGKNLWYPGSPLAFNFSEGLVDHGFIVYDTSSGEHEFVSLQGDNAIKDEDIVPAFSKPARFITITDEMLLDANEIKKIDFKNNNIRIAISRDYSRDEIADIRSTLSKMGAKNVTTMKTKEQEVEIDKEQSDSVSINKPEELLKIWFEKDAPAHISKDLLFSLNKSIVEEGNERLVQEGDVDAE